MRPRANIGAAVAAVAALWGGLASGLPNVVQEHYRWRNDDGSETSATWKAADDCPFRQQVRGCAVRLRFCLSNADGLDAAVGVRPRLEYALNRQDTFTAVPANATTEPFEMAASPFLANGEATTKQVPGSGAYVAGQCVEHPSNAGEAHDLPAERYSNYEYCLRATGQAKGGTTYYFRLTDAGMAFNEYPVYAELAVVSEPELDNASGADEIGVTTARLGGRVLETAGDAPAVTVFWGRADGGTNGQSWDHAAALGVRAGDFSVVATGLLANATYYYRCYGTNLGGASWAPSTSAFATASPVVHFAANPYLIGESAGQIALKAELRTPSAERVAFHYRTANGTAAAGRDYAATPGSIEWQPGTTGAQSFAVAILDDTGDEPDETFDLLFDNPTRCTLSRERATVVILDDDGLPTVCFESSLSSGPEGLAHPSIRVVLVPASGQEVTVRVAASGGTAKEGPDFGLPFGTVTLPAGRTSTNIDLVVVDDTEYEAAETVTLTLSEPRNALIGYVSGHTYTIQDSDPRAPRVTNGRGAARISSLSAAMRGEVEDTGRDEPVVSLYWGRVDGSTNAAAWSFQAMVGLRGTGVFESVAGGLVPGALYFYRCHASNSAGVGWAASSENFVAADPPSFLLLENESMEAAGAMPGAAENWTCVGDKDILRSDAFPRTGSHSMEMKSVSSIYVYGSGKNAFRVSWDGQYLDGVAHPGGGVRPGYILGGLAYVRAQAVGCDPSRFTYSWRNLDDSANWMTNTLTTSATIYQEIGLTNRMPVPAADVRKRFVPAIRRETVGTTDEDRFHADDLSIRVGLPRLALERDPSEAVRFQGTRVGEASELRLGARNQGGAPASVLYGAYVMNPADLVSPDWSATAWCVTYDPAQAFSVAAGAALVATNDEGWCYATLRFRPPATGSYTGVVRVATTDPADRHPGGGKLQGSIVYEQYVLVGQGLPPLPVVSTQPAAAREGDAGLRPLSVPLVLDAAAGERVTVRYATLDGTARAGVDYIAVSGEAVILPGERQTLISVPIIGNRALNGHRFFHLLLSDPVNARLGVPASAAFTIVDDDGPLLLVR